MKHSENQIWCLNYLKGSAPKRKLYKLTYNGNIVVNAAPYAVCASRRKSIPSNEKYLCKITPVMT